MTKPEKTKKAKTGIFLGAAAVGGYFVGKNKSLKTASKAKTKSAKKTLPVSKTEETLSKLYAESVDTLKELKEGAQKAQGLAKEKLEVGVGEVQKLANNLHDQLDKYRAEGHTHPLALDLEKISAEAKTKLKNIHERLYKK